MEPIDILDEETREKTGEVRSIHDVHELGLWHRSSRVWVVNSKNEILLQHRDKNLIEFPDRWDVSAAGHITSGSNSLDTAINEAKEELGLDVKLSEIKLITTIKKRSVSNDGTYIDNSFEDIYIMKKDIEIDSLEMQKGEVQNIRWEPLEVFKKKVSEKNTEYVPHWDEYTILIEEIEK